MLAKLESLSVRDLNSWSIRMRRAQIQSMGPSLAEEPHFVATMRSRSKPHELSQNMVVSTLTIHDSFPDEQRQNKRSWQLTCVETMFLAVSTLWSLVNVHFSP